MNFAAELFAVSTAVIVGIVIISQIIAKVIGSTSHEEGE